MAKINSVLNEVLIQITPSKIEHEEIKKIIKKVMTTAEKIIKPFGLKSVLAGSFIRNTYMLDKKEFDLFILFPENYSREKLEKLSLDLGKKIVNKLDGTYVIAYAEHPYVRAEIEGYDVDIVPCYKVKSAEKIKSAVDRTPFHNKWLKENMPESLSSEVRLLKQFCKGLRIYGSDTKTLGVSGYLCELLITHYKSFRNFVIDAAKWNPGKVFIDLAKHYKDTEKIKKCFKEQALVVIDPVDKKRNVAASLSSENFMRLVSNAKLFLRNPSSSFFFRSKIDMDLAKLKKIMHRRKTLPMMIVFNQPQIIQDVLWPQLRKTARRLKDILTEYSFNVIGFDVWSDKEFEKNGKSVIFLEMGIWELFNLRKIVGPSIFSLKNATDFLKKYKNYKGVIRIFVEDKYWVAEADRKFKTAEQKLKDSLSDPIDVLMAKGIPKYIAQSISSWYKILKEFEILDFVKKKPQLFDFLMNYFTKEIV